MGDDDFDSGGGDDYVVGGTVTTTSMGAQTGTSYGTGGSDRCQNAETIPAG